MPGECRSVNFRFRLAWITDCISTHVTGSVKLLFLQPRLYLFIMYSVLPYFDLDTFWISVHVYNTCTVSCLSLFSHLLSCNLSFYTDTSKPFKPWRWHQITMWEGKFVFNDIVHSEILSFVYQWFHKLAPSCFVLFFICEFLSKRYLSYVSMLHIGHWMKICL